MIGSVQGVGFRYFVQKNANAMNLVGWVKNNADLSVSLLVQGDELVIQKFLDLVKIGPAFARVSNLKISSQNVSETLKLFEILH